jgi:ankyrin repeat protein
MGLLSFLSPKKAPDDQLRDGLQNNSVGVVIDALSAGANPELMVAVHGFNALHYASLKGYATIVQALLDAGAAPNYQNQLIGGQTHLHVAIINGHTDVVEILLRQGADPNFGRWITGESALQFVVMRSAQRKLYTEYRFIDEKIESLLRGAGAK